jgi:DNA-directed RNA polymerase subunit K/omega
MSKRANQLAAQMKEELHSKLDEFNNDSDTLEEIFENREQIEISMAYERLPKPTLIATEEFLNEKVYHRNPEKEKRLAEGN